MDRRNTLAYDRYGAELISIKSLGEFYGHD